MWIIHLRICSHLCGHWSEFLVRMIDTKSLSMHFFMIWLIKHAFCPCLQLHTHVFNHISVQSTHPFSFHSFQHTDEEVARAYEEFYEDVHTEFLKFGEMVNFKVSISSCLTESYVLLINFLSAWCLIWTIFQSRYIRPWHYELLVNVAK